MARRPAKGKGYDEQFDVTQRNLDKKGKTNKKLKRNPMASKHLTPKGKEIIEAAAAFVKEHPARSGYKYRKNQKVNG